MTSWKTTVAGIVSAVAAIVAGNPGNFVKWPWLVTAAQFVVAGGLAAIGIAAKDSGVTGGDKLATGAVPDAQLHAAAANEAVTKG
jgi:ABC-type uncharacterized transport system substrate-binding protein